MLSTRNDMMINQNESMPIEVIIRREGFIVSSMSTTKARKTNN